MSTPIHELPEPTYSQDGISHGRRPSSDEGTFVEKPFDAHFTEQHRAEPIDMQQTSSHARLQNARLEDELEFLKAERFSSGTSGFVSRHKSQSRFPGTDGSSNEAKEMNDYDVLTGQAVHDPVKGLWEPPKIPASKVAKVFKMVHEKSILVRYLIYITPIVLLILVPMFISIFAFRNLTIGGVKLLWFCVWLQIVWLSLWAGRILAKMLPYLLGVVFSLFTNNSKKWRDMVKMLEIPATLFFWWLAIFISFVPTMTNHHANGVKTEKHWEIIVDKIIISVFVATVLNFGEKIIIQLIAISFHQRTYEDRISLNKFQIGSLTKLLKHSRDLKIEEESVLESTTASGARTPLVYLKRVRDGAHSAANRVTDVAGKVAADFTGREVQTSNSPYQTVLNLLNTNDGSQVLARRLYRTFVRPGNDMVLPADLANAFDSEEEADAAYTMFDRDLNGDISCEEMEMACIEIGRERKAILASLKDLDSVISKLDDVLTFIVIIITILIFISIISASTAAMLASASTSILALSWLFSATAQEFLQSLIFVFVKHPFDVGDRVDIMVNGEVNSYFVKEIALMYTEFKKMEGHIVQAPNSILNTLFILNMRRSPALAEAVPITIKFGTTIDQIEELRKRLVRFVTSEKRDFQDKILTELRKIDYLHEVTLNIVLFYKSNWQNELLRLQRRNKFMCALMTHVSDLNIESPHKRWAGQTPGYPMYLSDTMTQQGEDHRDDILDERTREATTSPSNSRFPMAPRSEQCSSSNAPQKRKESFTEQAKRMDFSLGASDMALSDSYGDAFTGESQIPAIQISRMEEENEARENLERSTSRSSRASQDSQGTVRRRERWTGRNRSSTVQEEREPDLESGLTAPEPRRNTSSTSSTESLGAPRLPPLTHAQGQANDHEMRRL